MLVGEWKNEPSETIATKTVNSKQLGGANQSWITPHTLHNETPFN